jgi:hypothetical protein
VVPDPDTDPPVGVTVAPTAIAPFHDRLVAVTEVAATVVDAFQRPIDLVAVVAILTVQVVIRFDDPFVIVSEPLPPEPHAESTTKAHVTLLGSAVAGGTIVHANTCPAARPAPDTEPPVDVTVAPAATTPFHARLLAVR